VLFTSTIIDVSILSAPGGAELPDHLRVIGDPPDVSILSAPGGAELHANWLLTGQGEMFQSSPLPEERSYRDGNLYTPKH